MSGIEIRRLVEEFLTMIDDGPALSGLDLVVALDRLACAAHSIPDRGCEPDRKKPSPPYPEAYNQARRAVSNRFPDLGHYNSAASLAGNIGSSECEVGDAVDDLADIYLDLTEVRFRFAEVSELSALQHLEWSFSSHWEFHLRNLQYYLFRRAFEAGEMRSG